MKTTPLLFAIAVVGLVGCGKKPDDATPAAGALPADERAKPRKPGWEYIPPPPPEPPPKAQTMTIVEKIPFGSAHSDEEVIARFRKDVAEMSSNDVSRAARALMASRTPEGMRETIRLLDEFEATIPTALPSQEEIDAMEILVNRKGGHLPMDHWKVRFRKSVELAATLLMYDVQEATTRAEKFRSSLVARWRNMPQAKIYLDSMNSEFKHAYADVKQGIMPWQERKFSD